MSYPTAITNQFIELRAKCVSLQRIADQLQINLSTAKDWNSRFKTQVDDLKAIHFEAICEKITTTYQDELEYAMQQLHAVRGILRERDWGYSETIEVHRAEKAIYKRVQSLRQLAELPAPTPGPAPIPEIPPTVDSQTQPQTENSQSNTENPPISHPFPTQKNDFSQTQASSHDNGTTDCARSNDLQQPPSAPSSPSAPAAPPPTPELDERPWWEREPSPRRP